MNIALNLFAQTSQRITGETSEWEELENVREYSDIIAKSIFTLAGVILLTIVAVLISGGAI